MICTTTTTMRWILTMSMIAVVVVMMVCDHVTESFLISPTYIQRSSSNNNNNNNKFHRIVIKDFTSNNRIQRQNKIASTASTTTSLNLLLDVPDGFFTLTFPMLGILLSISKNFARIRMEERAWEQRLEEGRAVLLKQNPSLTELDLRRQEAEQEWSAYGIPAKQERELRKQQKQKRRVAVMDREDEYVSSKRGKSTTSDEYKMTNDEIDEFEKEYGILYDPYYDDPYTENELPNDMKYSIDRLYGDRIYENGEIFYKDSKTGLFYRQGSKPRNFNFF